MLRKITAIATVALILLPGLAPAQDQGAHLFPEEVILIAETETADLLAVAQDPMRPLPDVVFEDRYVLETGGLRLEMRDLERSWHS